MTSQTDPWGPRAEGDASRRGARFLGVAGLVALAVVLAVATTGVVLYQQADSAVDRVPVEGLSDPDEGDEGPETKDSDARNFLVVGSDSREDVEHADKVATGGKEGQRSDVIMYVSVTDDREGISIVSIPRDLVVELDGREMRINYAFEEGASNLVAAVQEQLGLPVHHYAEINFDGFINAVDTIGGVDMCLEDDLVDPDAGADLEAGCQRLAPAEALAFVRSRQGTRGDYERIERQQRFLRATVDELTQRRILANVPQLFDLIEDVSGNVSTDEDLSLPEMLGLADNLRDVLGDDIPMASVPAYPDSLGPAEVMRIYEPGARALFEDVRAGRQIADRGTRDERDETSVAIWSGGRGDGLEIVGSVLHYGGFTDYQAVGPGPSEFDAGSTTTVYAPSGDKAEAEWVAALLGAPIRELPTDVEVPEGADVVVAVGRDAAGSGGTLRGAEGRLETRQADEH